MKTPILTEIERSAIDALFNLPTAKKFGNMIVTGYKGANRELRELSNDNKVIGLAWSRYNKDTGAVIWFVDATNGERYRIPEPKDGIESILEMEFKRL